MLFVDKRRYVLLHELWFLFQIAVLVSWLFLLVGGAIVSLFEHVFVDPLVYPDILTILEHVGSKDPSFLPFLPVVHRNHLGNGLKKIRVVAADFAILQVINLLSFH